MKKAALEPSEGTGRPIFVFLTRHRDRPLLARTNLEDLHQENLDIPTAAMNIVLEAAIAHGNLEEAMDHYRSLQEICSSGPNTATFNTLLQGCYRTGGNDIGNENIANKDIAMSLAAEMSALGVRPDILTYDRLIIICMKSRGTDFEDTFLYYKEMREALNAGEGGLRRGTWKTLIQTCIERGDERVWGLLDDMENEGNAATTLRKLAETSFSQQSALSSSLGSGDEMPSISSLESSDGIRKAAEQ